MSRLTNSEWADLAKKTVDYYIKDNLRLGQSYMNALADINIDLYNQITATKYDCFYSDDKIVKFVKFLNNEQIEVDEKI